MPNVDQHAPGAFCWIELGTSDQNAAKHFYTTLFGWTVQDFPMGPSDFYSIFQLNGRDAGAAYTLRPDQQAQGVPPHWMIYLAAESADESAKRAAELGGTVLAEPFDVYDSGRMAVLKDPTGAVFAVWEPKKHKGIAVWGDPGSLCWADLNTPDPEAAKKFYGDLFGWTFMTDKDGYVHIKLGEHFIGGMPSAQHQQAGVPPHWLPYFAVNDADQTAESAEGMGARLYLKPMTMENVGRMAVIADPQGAVFAIFKGR